MGEKTLVAVAERRDDKVMAVGRKQHGYAEQGQEVADQHALLALGRIRGDEAEPALLGDDGTCDSSADGDARGGAEDDADHDLMHHQHEQRGHRSHVDVVARWRGGMSVSSSAIESLTRTGMFELPRPGNNITMARARAKAGVKQQRGPAAGKAAGDESERRILRARRARG